jgi:hypothetical protein
VDCDRSDCPNDAGYRQTLCQVRNFALSEFIGFFSKAERGKVLTLATKAIELTENDNLPLSQ